MSNVYLSTAPLIAGYDAEETLGILTSNTVMGVSALTEGINSFTDFFGGRSVSLESLVQDGNEAVLEDILGQAEKHSAGNDVGVISVNLDYHHFHTGAKAGMILVVATGTLVKLRKST